MFAVMATVTGQAIRLGNAGLAVRFRLGRSIHIPVPTEKVTANGATTDQIVRDANMIPKPMLDAAGKPIPFMVAYPEKDEKGDFLTPSECGFSSGSA